MLSEDFKSGSFSGGFVEAGRRRNPADLARGKAEGMRIQQSQ